MKKRTLSLLLALVMIIGLLPVTAQAGELGNGLQYEVYADHVEITGYTGEPTEIVIPAEIEGLPVTSINHLAFSGCSSLTNIVIPESVTYIDNLAFQGCSSLTGIHVDDNNMYYSSDGQGVLFDKEKTELILAPSAITGSYTIPDSVTNIGQSAFEGCSSLTNIVIPESVTVIGVYTFKGCSSLSTIVIPKSVTEIYYGAFSYCSNLTSIVIPKNVSYIAYDAFSYCSRLIGIQVDNNNLYYSSDEQGVLFDKEKTELIKAPGAIMGSYIIPDSVTNIGQCAFEGCFNLTSIDIPNSVTDIEYMAFSNCSKLTGIHVDNSNLHYFSDNWGVLFDKEKTILIEAPGAITGSYAIPSSITSISWYAFKDCSRLSSIEIPDSVTVMGCDSFAGCTSLNSIYFKGDAPAVYHDYADVSFETAFFGVTASFYYPAGNPTWTAEVMVDSHGAFTWIGYNPDGTFYDVEMGSWYENPVEWAVEEGITSGATETEFAPEDTCQRAQVVTFLWRAAGEPKAKSAVNPFVDVKPDKYYYDAVLWAVEQGITTGMDDTHFEPYGICNRSQVVTFLYRAFQEPPVKNADNPFTDVPAGKWYTAPVLWAVQEGITNGLSATEFGPDDVCKRSQVVTFLYRAYN